MNIRERVTTPDSPEQDAAILRRGLRNTLLCLAAGAAVYLLAAALTFWR